jgi:hypothetical protein
LQPALAGVDYVIHLAALPSVARSIADPLTANAVNLTGTLNVLLAAQDAGIKQVARTVPPCGIRVFSAAIIATVLYRSQCRNSGVLFFQVDISLSPSASSGGGRDLSSLISPCWHERSTERGYGTHFT